eukprot:m.305022 g.305022  ORF g.305022 m.305022 type:complete len:659 (+) comp55279_c0_seq2:46-2022(+)
MASLFLRELFPLIYLGLYYGIIFPKNPSSFALMSAHFASADVASDIVAIYLLYGVSDPLAIFLIAFMVMRLLLQIAFLLYERPNPWAILSTIFDLEAARAYVLQEHDEELAEIYEAVLESGPSFVVQSAIFMYFSTAPHGIDVVSFYLVSMAVSALSLSSRYGRLCNKTFNGGQLNMTAVWIQVYSFLDVVSSCLSLAAFGYLVSSRLNDEQLDSTRDDVALVVGLVISLVSVGLVVYIFARLFNSGSDTYKENRILAQLQWVSNLFSDTPLAGGDSSFFRVGRTVFSIVIQITFGVAACTSIPEVGIGIGVTILATLVLRLIVMFTTLTRIFEEKGAGTTPDDSPISSLYVVRGILAVFVVGLAVAFIAVVASTNIQLTSSHTDKMTCDNLAHSQLFKLLSIRSVDELIVERNCRTSYLTDVQPSRLVIRAHSDNDFSFPALQTLPSSLVIDYSDSSMPTKGVVTFSALSSVGGDVTFVNARIDRISTPALQTISGDVSLRQCIYDGVSNPLPGLQTVGGTFSFEDGSNLDAAFAPILLPTLASIAGGLSVTSSTAAFPKIRFPALTSLGGDLNCFSAEFDSIELPALTTISGDLTVRETTVSSLVLTALTAIAGSNIVLCANQFVTPPSQVSSIWSGKSCKISGVSACPSAFSPCS